MSLPNPDVDLEQGQVSERRSDAGVSSPITGGQQPVERPGSIRRTSVDQDLGLLLPIPVSVGTPHVAVEHRGSVRPTSFVSTTRQEDPAGIRREEPSVGQDTSQIPGNTTHSQGTKHGPGEIFGDPSRQMWTLSLSQFEKYDQEITDRWKSESDGVLVFTGLFSATVATFIIESYQMLSVDSGGQTVTLLAQMSQQLVAISNGTVLPTPPPLSNSPSNLPAAVRINILWLLSLAISITCALLATLVQQWCRRYMALSYLHDMPHERARVRTFLFTGMEYFRMRQAVEAIPLLLHTSVFLFFAGLIDFFLLSNNTVAWVFIGWVGLFGSVYVAMTVVPNILFSCPYRTPYTGLLWRLSHMLAVITLVFTDTFATILDGFLRHSWGLWGRMFRGAYTSIPPLLDRKKMVKRIATHKYWFGKGLRRRVVSKAIDASSSVDRDALIWTLSRLDEDKEVEDYISRIPGFFDSRVVPDALPTMLGLMDSPSSGGDSVLAARLSGLLKTCLPTASGIDSGVDKDRLNICLTAIWCYTKAYNRRSLKGVPMSHYFRELFANQNEMNALLENDDPRTKVMTLCMGSLLVARLTEEMEGQTENPQVSEGELVFLKKALGPLWRLDLASHKPTQLTNLDSMLTEIEEVAKEHMPAGETLGHEVLDTMTLLAEDVADSISSPPTDHQGLDLSVLKSAHGLLERCLTLSKQCGVDPQLGGLMKSDAFNSLLKILEGLDTKLSQHPESLAHVHGPDEEVQSTTHEDVLSAISATPPKGKEALTSTLAELHEDNEFEAFVNRIPNLLDSYDVADTMSRRHHMSKDTSIDNMLDLMAPSSGSESTLALRLHKFFKAYLPGKSTPNLDVCKRRLRICLTAIWSYARAYSNSDPRQRPIPEHFQRLFADPNDMDRLSADGDTDTRVMALSINSLLATKIVEDIRHRPGNPQASEGELAFLQKALGSFWRPGLPSVSPGPTELANLLAMLEGLAKLARQETSPLKTLGREASETLEILATAVKERVPEDVPPERWGSSASEFGQSREALQQCLLLLGQMSEGEDALVKSAWVDALIGRLSDLDTKLAPLASPDPPQPPQSPRIRTQSHSFGHTPSAVNLLVTPTDGPSEEQFAATMREPELSMGQQYSRVNAPFHYQPYLLQRHQG